MKDFNLELANDGHKVQIQRNHFNRFANEVGGDEWNDLGDYKGLKFYESSSPKGYINIFDNRSKTEALMSVRKEYLRMKYER